MSGLRSFDSFWSRNNSSKNGKILKRQFAAATAGIGRLSKTHICLGQLLIGVSQLGLYVHSIDTVSYPMMNHIFKSFPSIYYLNLGALFHFFLWLIYWNLYNLALVICLFL